MLSTLAILWLGFAPGPEFDPDAATDVGIEPPGPAPIVGGEEVESGNWPEVVAFDGTTRCTGVLLTPRLVFTAAHCLEDAFRAITYIGGETIDVESAATAERWAIHPDFCRHCPDEMFDFAYVLLDQPVNIGKPFPQPIVDQEEWDRTMQLSTPVTLIGFGSDGTGPNEQGGAGVKRVVETRITEFTQHVREFRAGENGKDSCAGDSGGPAMVQLPDGRWRVAGILSRGTTPCGRGGYYGIPYPALEWLNEETGYDVLDGTCDSFKCLELAPEETGLTCAVDPSRDLAPGSLALFVLLLFPRRQRP